MLEESSKEDEEKEDFIDKRKTFHNLARSKEREERVSLRKYFLLC